MKLKTPNFWGLKTSMKQKSIKPIKSFTPVKLNIYPSRTKTEWKLIDKKPYGDKDGDKLMNFFDCRPKIKKMQDFGAFKYKYKKGAEERKVDEYTAAERFGGANIKKLKRLGAGRDRVVYQLDKDKVLKVAKNVGGLRQNQSENDYFLEQSGLRPKHYESGKDYVVMEKAGKLSKENKRKLKEVHSHMGMYQSFGQDKVIIERNLAKQFPEQDFNDLMNYDVSAGDLTKPSSWGEKEGKIVLIDAGGLNKENLSIDKSTIKKLKDKKDIILKHVRDVEKQDATTYANEDPRTEQTNYYKNMAKNLNTEIQEWEGVTTSRRQFRKKGEKMERERHSEVPEALESLPDKNQNQIPDRLESSEKIETVDDTISENTEQSAQDLLDELGDGK